MYCTKDQTQSKHSLLPTCFDTPGVPSSRNFYIAISCAFELVQHIKPKCTPVSTKTPHTMLQCQKILKTIIFVSSIYIVIWGPPICTSTKSGLHRTSFYKYHNCPQRSGKWSWQHGAEIHLNLYVEYVCLVLRLFARNSQPIETFCGLSLTHLPNFYQIRPKAYEVRAKY